jgi:hypothetical protein
MGRFLNTILYWEMSDLERKPWVRSLCSCIIPPYGIGSARISGKSREKE